MSENSKIHILYISSVCADALYKELEKNVKEPMQYSIQKFHNAIINGLNKSKNVKIDALCGLPINRKNIKKIMFKKITVKNKNVKYVHMRFINLPIVKQISICMGMVCGLIKWNKQNKENKNKIIIFDASYITITPVLVFISKILKIKKVAIVADIYGYMSDKIKERKGGTLQNILAKICQYCWNNYDGYILLTEQMNKIVNPKSKPYIIMEGIADKIDITENVKKENYVMYAGSLFDRFGIKELVDGFDMLEDKSLKLYIYGAGETVEYIKKKESQNASIQYKGTKTNNEILLAERKAKLLINPRPTNNEFTKYSFPSKTIEYMLSGTPVLTTRLDGIPSEYNDYLYFIDDESAIGIKNSIENIMKNESNDDLNKKGRGARKFICDNKNSEVQGKRINKFIKSILKEEENYDCK